jgi:hypothetical protein
MANQAALTLDGLRLHIEGKIGQTALTSMLVHLQANEATLSLWGLEKPTSFLENQLHLLLYHDISGLGHKIIQGQLHRAEVNMYSHKSMLHNGKILRDSLANWADTNIVLGNADTWNAAAVNSNFPPSLKDANLWVDSVDIKLKGICSRKGPGWSYKLNHQGVRWLTVADARRRVRALLGPHSPKLHDGSYMETHKEEIKRDYVGGRFVADNHFQKAKRIFDPDLSGDNIKFYTNFSKKRKGTVAEPADNEDVEKVTNANIRFNRDHQGVRARVETPYAWIKNTFKAMNMWAESEAQLHMLLKIAIAIHNLNILIV